MKGTFWTWGTGAAFGRELGDYTGNTAFTVREQRDHAANSLIFHTAGGETALHLMVDAGAPATEKIVRQMMRGRITRGPEVLFFTHSHTDHHSDLHKLVNSRERGLQLAGAPVLPFPIIGTAECLLNEKYGLKAKFGYFGGRVDWLPVPAYGVWYHIEKPQPGGASGEPAWALRPTYDAATMLPVAFMALPVNHRSGDYGPCLYIFRRADAAACPAGCGGGNCPNRVVVTGDFETIPAQSERPCLLNPALLVMDTNTIRAPLRSTGHTWLHANTELVKKWTSPGRRTQVLLTHISGFEDSVKAYAADGQEQFGRIPSDEEWEAEAAAAEQAIRAAGTKVTVKVAHDNASYGFRL